MNSHQPVVRERPIPFMPDMVRAVLRDTDPKTQTRRIVKAPPEGADGVERQVAATTSIDLKPGTPFWRFSVPDGMSRGYTCPHGAPGDRLWVRESLRANDKGEWHYAADDAPVLLKQSDPRFSQMVMWAHHKDSDFCPPMFMPRFACRIVLELDAVRLERIQHITEDDAKAEGARWVDTGLNEYRQQRPGWSMLDPHPARGDMCLGTAPLAFANYISTLSSRRRRMDTSVWDSNAWVWALTFKPLEIANR